MKLKFLVLPLLAAAQQSSTPLSSVVPAATSVAPASSVAGGTSPAVAQPSVSVILSTSLTTGITIGPGRVESTFTSGVVITITPAPATPTNGTSNGNNTVSAAPTTSSSTAPLPTAATSIYGGGDAPGGAPSPGASAPGGVFGPPDSYTSSVSPMQLNSILFVVAGVVVGGVMVVV